MTERIYYTDAYVSRFEARVIAQALHEGRPSVILDRTAFYPTSGGQPADRGTIAGVAVIDVVDLEDGRILHVLDGPLDANGAVAGEIDWDRRHDHMQQHTGQHVLSAALERVLNLPTESVHLGAVSSTIDVSGSVTLEGLAPVEREANAVVFADRPVRVRFVDAEEAARLPLRKPPPRDGVLRLVDIEEVDLSACGGTHVARTGAIGLIAVGACERYKGGTRVEFACGTRALMRFQQLRDVVASSARLLSCAGTDVPAALERLRSELKEQRHALRSWQERSIEAEAARLSAEHPDGAVVSRHLDGWDAQALRSLGAALAADPPRRAVLTGGEPGTVIVACGSAAGDDAGAVIRRLVARFGGRGGGRRELAQGGGLVAAPDEIRRAAFEDA